MTYQISKSQTILENYQDFLQTCYTAKDWLSERGFDDTTFSYNKYNLFAELSGSYLMWNLYKEICLSARNYLSGYDGPLWMQSWLNFHKQEEVLDWHDHQWEFHGYISVEPKCSKTVFESWEIENEIGNIYIGPGNLNHKVEVVEPYDDYRITIGLDFSREKNLSNNILIPVC